MAQTRFSGPVASDNGFIGTVDSTSGNFDELVVTGNVDMQGTGNVFILPTSDPGVVGAIWNNGGNVDISV